MCKFLTTFVCLCLASTASAQYQVAYSTGGCPGGICPMPSSSYQQTIRTYSTPQITYSSPKVVERVVERVIEKPRVSYAAPDFRPNGPIEFSFAPKVDEVLIAMADCPNGQCTIVRTEPTPATGGCGCNCDSCTCRPGSQVRTVYRTQHSVMTHGPIRAGACGVARAATAPVRFFRERRPVRRFFGRLFGGCR